MSRAPLSGLLLLTVAATGCGAPSPSARPTPATAPTASSKAVPSAPAIRVDDELLSSLPVSIDGITLGFDAAAAREIASDAGLAQSVVAVAVAQAFARAASGVAASAAADPGTGLDGVVVTVAQLRDGVFDAAFYRAWRDTFDRAACAAGGAAGDVVGHAESTISGRAVAIGTCASGVHTYHVYLPGRQLLISMQAVGSGRYGELVAAGLRE